LAFHSLILKGQEAPRKNQQTWEP